MCQYVKDDGEQCGRTAEPFCHDHEDSPQAKLWSRIEERFEDMEEMTQKVLSGAQSGSDFGTMNTTCEECGAALRRRERLTEHPRFGGKVLFEAYVECDCSEHVLGAQSVRDAKVPDGWSG